jgi:small subunit ribosomal protein S20
MAHDKSAKKRIRQTAKRRLENRYYGKTTRNAIRKIRSTTDQSEATALLPSVISMIDKLAKRNQIHKNKAANLKSSVMKHVNALSA